MISNDYVLKYDDTLVSLFGEANARIHDKLKNHSVYKMFMDRFRKIHWIGKNNGVDPGEVLLMIYRTYEFSLEDCPWGVLPDVRDFVTKNIDTRYKIIYPELHEYLIKTNYYNISSTLPAPKQMIAGTVKQLFLMMKKHCSIDDFNQFGIELSKA